MSEAKKIMLYGADWCGDCRRSKGYLMAHGVSFTYVDVDADAAAKEQKKLAMAEMVSRDKQGKQYEELGSSASAFGGRSGVSESSDKSARLMAQVAALGSPPLWNEGLGSMLVAGKTNLKKTPPPAVSDTSTRMSAFSRGGGGSSTGTTLNYSNPLMNTRNPMLDNPMFKLRQRMEAEDNSSGF
jgi:glutaredoxin